MELGELGADGVYAVEGVFGEGVVLGPDAHLIRHFEGDVGFVEGAVGLRGGGEVEVELVGEEFVHGEALVGAVVVTFPGEVGVLDVVGGAEEGVDFLQEGELSFGDVLGPVGAVGDDEHGAWGAEGSDFGVGAEVVGIAVDGAAGLALAAAEEVGGDHDAGDVDGDAGVEGGEEEGLGGAAGFAGDAELGGIDIGEGGEEVEGADVLPELHGRGEIGFGVGAGGDLGGGVAVGEHFIGEGDGAQAGEGGAAMLDIFSEAAARFGVAVAVGIEDGGEFCGGGVEGAVEGAAGVIAGDGFEGDGFGGVAVVGALVENVRVEGCFFRPGVEACAALDGGAEVGGVLLPGLSGGGEVVEGELEGGFALVGFQEVAAAEGRAVRGERREEGGLGFGVGGGVGIERGRGGGFGAGVGVGAGAGEEGGGEGEGEGEMFFHVGSGDERLCAAPEAAGVDVCEDKNGVGVDSLREVQCLRHGGVLGGRQE